MKQIGGDIKVIHYSAMLAFRNQLNSKEESFSIFLAYHEADKYNENGDAECDGKLTGNEITDFFTRLGNELHGTKNGKKWKTFWIVLNILI